MSMDWVGGGRGKEVEVGKTVCVCIYLVRLVGRWIDRW